MIRVAVLLLCLLMPSLAVSAGNDLASVSKYNHAIMIVVPEASENKVPVVSKPDDCGDTRWLSREGRAMAEDIGRALHAAGFGEASVFSSQSCDTIEAANLLNLKNRGPRRFLNDISKAPISRARQREALALFMADYQGKPTLVFVTHDNNVIDISGTYPEYGDIIAVSVDVSDFEPVFRSYIRWR